METKKKMILRGEGGFTLIEIIAVLVILGILAAVAVPKFTQLQADAADKALDGALAAAYSTCSLEYARLVLAGGTVTVANVVTAAGSNEPGGTGFTYAWAANAAGTGVTCTVTDTDSNSKSGDWIMP